MKNMKALLQAIALFLITAGSVCGQESAITTFILVRHAEKETGAAAMENGVMSKDPELSEQGKARALRLADMFQRQPIAAIYSTNYKRTQNTVRPLAEKLGITIQVYQPAQDQIILDMLARHKGQTVLVVGHSNTIPQIANLLLGKKEYGDYDDSYYENIMLVSVVEKGTASVIQVKY